MAPIKENLKIIQGGTFQQVIRWESSTLVYKNITNATKAAPLVITAVAHDLVIGWRAKVSNVLGMKEINSDDYVVVTDSTTDTVTIGAINAAGYTTYTSNGVLTYNAPISLTGYTAKMQIRSNVASEVVILELSMASGGIAIDNTLKTITINITAAATAALTFKSAVYSLEMTSGTIVTPLVFGTISLEAEITR